jgi:hypothetical protein
MPGRYKDPTGQEYYLRSQTAGTLPTRLPHPQLADDGANLLYLEAGFDFGVSGVATDR